MIFLTAAMSHPRDEKIFNSKLKLFLTLQNNNAICVPGPLGADSKWGKKCLKRPVKGAIMGRGEKKKGCKILTALDQTSSLLTQERN